jgi:hypothetical protein
LGQRRMDRIFGKLKVNEVYSFLGSVKMFEEDLSLGIGTRVFEGCSRGIGRRGKKIGSWRI